MKKNYDRLYLDILKIGIKKADTGISYDQVIIELQKLGYDCKNECLTLAIEQWFFDCFHHILDGEHKVETLAELRLHHDCGFIMKGESCLALLNYQTSKRNERIAIVALFIAAISIIITLWQSKEQAMPSTQHKQEIVMPDLSTNQYYLQSSDTTNKK